MKKGWQTKTLGEICTVDWGNTDLTKSAYVEGGKFLAVSAAGCDGRIGHKEHEKYTPVLSAIGAQCGRMFLPEEDFTAIKNTITLTPRDGTCTGRFLYQLLTHVELPKRGAAQPFISKGDIQSFQVPVPPLAEQQRIVGLLDEAFEGLATAKANAEKNLQNARDLFESHLQSVFTQRGPGWVEKPFEELIESNIIGLTKNSREQGEDKAWPYVKMNNITRDNRFDFSRFTCVDATAEEVSKFSLKDGDFLFNTRNSHELVGKSCIYESDSNDAVLYNNNIMRVRFQRGIDARFVLLAFSSKGVADELNALKSGTTNVSAIYFKDLKSLVIPVPPIVEQKKIAAKLDALSEETQRLARLYERKLAALEALKKSLLHQAFSGNL